MSGWQSGWKTGPYRFVNPNSPNDSHPAWKGNGQVINVAHVQGSKAAAWWIGNDGAVYVTCWHDLDLRHFERIE